jgi:hypothetical protein
MAKMEMRLWKGILALAVLVALTMTVTVSAGESAGAANVPAVLGATPAAELPLRAAQLVAEAEANTLRQRTLTVVQAAVGLNPAATPAVVGCIAKTSPEAATMAAMTAVALLPDQAPVIARAAAAEAPAQAGPIVEAICQIVPADYHRVADTVADMVPGASREILAGVAAALPELKDPINQALAGYPGKLPSVGAVLARMPLPQHVAAPVLTSPGPISSAARVRVSRTPSMADPGGGWEMPTEGFDCSVP